MNSASVLITGDVHLGGGRVKDLATIGEREKLFASFLNLIKESDIAITNLESPVINDGTPSLKTGPNLKSPVDSFRVLADSGFNLLTLANNHIMDYGIEGLKSSVEVCKKFGLNSVGAGQNIQEAERPYIQNVNGTVVGIINIAENEFGTTFDSNPGCHGLNPVKNYYSIQETSKDVDFLIVIVHGGHENYPLPSPAMKERYRFFVDSGADLVVGHHPHCYSGFEIYNRAQIHYSVGNFLYDKAKKDDDRWNQGYILKLIIEKERHDIETIPYIQNGEKAGLRELSNAEKVKFEKEFKRLSKIISNEKELNDSFERYCDKLKNRYSSYLEPHSIRSLHFLRNRNLFPSFMSRRKKRLLLNLARCEAHRDVLMNILKS